MIVKLTIGPLSRYFLFLEIICMQRTVDLTAFWRNSDRLTIRLTIQLGKWLNEHVTLILIHNCFLSSVWEVTARCRYIPHYASLSATLSDLLKKGAKFEWKDRTEEAFLDTKSRWASQPVPIAPDFAIGAVLMQEADGLERPVCYLTSTWSGTPLCWRRLWHSWSQSRPSVSILVQPKPLYIQIIVHYNFLTRWHRTIKSCSDSA